MRWASGISGGRRNARILTATAEDEPGALYEEIAPILPLGLPFVRTAVSEDWFDWPALPDLFPVSFPGVKTSRDGFLVDVDLARLQARVRDYFDPDVSHEEIARHYPGVIKATAGFNARKVRDALLARGGPNDGGFVRFAYRPFDTRWLYWEAGGRRAPGQARRQGRGRPRTRGAARAAPACASRATPASAECVGWHVCTVGNSSTKAKLGWMPPVLAYRPAKSSSARDPSVRGPRGADDRPARAVPATGN